MIQSRLNDLIIWLFKSFNNNKYAQKIKLQPFWFDVLVWCNLSLFDANIRIDLESIPKKSDLGPLYTRTKGSILSLQFKILKFWNLSLLIVEWLYNSILGLSITQQ